MKKYTYLVTSYAMSFLFLSIILYSVPTYSNIIWPALIVTSAIFKSLFLLVFSIVIEAMLLYWLIEENMSYSKALFMSLVGNLVSVLIGSIVMTLAMVLWHIPFDLILGGTFHIFNVIANYLLMYLGSSFIELVSIKLIFNYSAKQLWIPVFIGNLITYALVALYNFPNELMMLLGMR